MIETKKLKVTSISSETITIVANNCVPNDEAINQFQQFKGVDGEKYLIRYNNRLNAVTNCYAFAMGWQEAADNKYDDYVPGFLSGNPYSVDACDNIVKADLKVVGRTVYEILYDIPEQLPDGEGYWIKFLHCPQKGELASHFMRKDKKSGRWIHKMGWKRPPNAYVRSLEFNKNEPQELDSANYVDIQRNGIPVTYQSMWVMRISEP